MVLGTLIRFGIPLSFVYCTISQQNIWREGDEKLIAEQKRTWKKFFGMLDCSYSMIANKINTGSAPTVSPRLGLVAKIESADLSQCWNTKVIKFFSKVDQLTSASWVDTAGLSKMMGFTK